MRLNFAQVVEVDSGIYIFKAKDWENKEICINVYSILLTSAEQDEFQIMLNDLDKNSLKNVQ